MVCQGQYYKVPAIVGAALAIAATGPKVAAQEAPGQVPSREAAEESSDIIVTAQRREERLVDVPISITALSAKLLEDAGITDTAEIDLVTTGLRMDQTGAFTQPAIRGVGTTISGPSDANVATYLDGVFQPTMLQAMFGLRDVSSVEVLKGPQGTLFGRNATGGAILVNTLSPDLNNVIGDIALGYSSFNTFEASEFVSIPLVKESVAASISSSIKHSDGYITDLLGRDDVGEYTSVLTRGKLRFVPWEGADFTLTGVYADIKDGLIYTRTSYLGHNSRASLAAAAGVPLANEPYEYSGDVNSVAALKYWSVSLRGEVDVGIGTITTTTAYVDNDSVSNLDGDNTPLSVVQFITGTKTNSFSQEVLFATKQIGRVRGIAGLFYIDKNVDSFTNVNSFANVTYADEHVKAWAVFGEVTLDVTDRLSVTGGMRYSSETFTGGRALTAGGTQVHPLVPTTANKTWTSVDPRFAIRYALSPNANIYASYSHGFKSGLFNVGSGQAAPVDPERIKAYEVGFKGQLGADIFLNLAAFYYDYKDLHQLVRINDPVTGTFQSLTQNAAVARIKGAELSGSMRLSDDFRITFGVTYLDARFTSFPAAQVTVWTPPSSIITTAINASGNRMVRAPEFSGNITATYDIKTSSGMFRASSTLFATSEVHHEASGRIVEPSYVKLNASLSWQPPGETGLKVLVYGKNLTDSTTIMGTTISTSYDGFSYEPPRSFGVEVSYKF